MNDPKAIRAALEGSVRAADRGNAAVPSMLAAGLSARLATVDMAKLDASFAGRCYDADLLADLPSGVDACGENGEFHTFVTDGPMFADPIKVEIGAVVVRDGFAYADLLPAD